MAACFDVLATEHYQVSYLVCWGVFLGWVGVLAYSFLRFFQSFLGLAMYGVYPIRIDLASWVEGFCCRRVHSHQMEAIVSVEWRHTVSYSDQAVVDKLGHWQQVPPVILFLADKSPEVGFNGLVEPFRLSVGLQVECRGHSGSYSGELQKFLPCFGRKPGVPV